MDHIFLKTAEGRHLGFIGPGSFLMHFDDDKTFGDCEFALVPADPYLLADEAVQRLFDGRGLGESKIEIDADPTKVDSRPVPGAARPGDNSRRARVWAMGRGNGGRGSGARRGTDSQTCQTQWADQE